MHWSGSSWTCRACKSVFPERDILRVAVKGASYNTRDISDAQEKYNAKLVQGMRTPGSGAFSDKSDVKAEDLRMECKSTGSMQYPLKRTDIELNEGHARGNEIPVFAVEFRAREGERKRQFMIVSEEWFMQLLTAWRTLERR